MVIEGKATSENPTESVNQVPNFSTNSTIDIWPKLWKKQLMLEIKEI
jgi:hypothetical protein